MSTEVSRQNPHRSRPAEHEGDEVPDSVPDKPVVRLTTATPLQSTGGRPRAKKRHKEMTKASRKESSTTRKQRMAPQRRSTIPGFPSWRRALLEARCRAACSFDSSGFPGQRGGGPERHRAERQAGAQCSRGLQGEAGLGYGEALGAQSQPRLQRASGKGDRHCAAKRSDSEGVLRKPRARCHRRPQTHLLVAFAALCLSVHNNRFHVGVRGETPHEILQGRRYRGALVPFGEVVMFCKGSKCKGDLQWQRGVWVDINERHGANILSTAEGTYESRSIRRLPDEEKWNLNAVINARGFPWNYQGQGKRKRPLYTSMRAGVPLVPDHATLHEPA